MNIRIATGGAKFLIGWAAVFLFRLIPFRPPNFEPMLATVMPFSKRFGALGGFCFAFFGIVLYDAVTSGWGTWTATTAVCYGLVAIAAHYFFRDREASVRNFLAFGVPATLAYDALTMWIGPVSWGQPVALAVAGQVPFTALHLLGTIVFAALLSPALYQWVVANEGIEMTLVGRVWRARRRVL